MKEILVFTDHVSKYGLYRSCLETVVTSISLRATLDEVFSHLSKKTVDVVIIDMEIPCVKKKDIKYIENLIRLGVKEVFLMVDEITDDCLTACVDYGVVIVIKKPFDPDILVSKLGLGTDLDAAEKDFDEVATCSLDSPFYNEDDTLCLEEEENEAYG